MSQRSTHETVDRSYNLLREIARGASHVVYEAQHTQTERRVAIKLLRRSGAGAPRGEASARRLFREARAAILVGPAHAPDILHAGTCTRHGPYIVMELLEGRTLAERLSPNEGSDDASRPRTLLSEDEALRLGRALCEALAHAHARGVVHGMLEPRRVFLANNARTGIAVKLLGLGAFEAHAPSGRNKRAQQSPALPAEYAAPELFAKDSAGATVACDVYAAAAILYECLTGAPPLRGDAVAIARQHASGAGSLPPDRLRPELSARLCAALLRALAQNPEDRFADALSFACAMGCVDEPAHTQAALREQPAPLETLAPIEGASPSCAPSSNAAQPPPPSRAPARAAPPPLPPVLERRQYTRVPYAAPVRLELPDGVLFDARAENLSEGGLQVATSSICQQGTRVRVTFPLPLTDEVASVEATVRWTRSSGEEQWLGLEFANIDETARRTIARFVVMMFPLAGTAACAPSAAP